MLCWGVTHTRARTTISYFSFFKSEIGINNPADSRPLAENKKSKPPATHHLVHNNLGSHTAIECRRLRGFPTIRKKKRGWFSNKREIEILKWCSSTQYEIREEEEEAQRVFSLLWWWWCCWCRWSTAGQRVCSTAVYSTYVVLCFLWVF